MNYGMERCPDMAESVRELADELIQQRVEAGKSGWEQGKRSIKDALCRMASGKEDGCITLSYLRSESAAKQYDFYMAYYDSDIFVEEEPEHQYICMAVFMEAVNEDMEIMEKEIKKKYIHVFKSEIAYIYSWYMDTVYERFKDVVADIIEDIRKKEGIAVYYGGYMDKQILLGFI